MTPSLMGFVRPFTEDDIPEVAELHRKVFRTAAESSPKLRTSYVAYFREIFLNNPWYEEDLPSLVYQDTDGTIAGFLGVVPRTFSNGGKPIRVALSSQFIVDPHRRAGLVAVQLIKNFLSGPQDISLADEAGNDARRLWESLGGTVLTLHSLYWGRFLRPSQFLLSRMTKNKAMAPLVFASTPFYRFVDAVAARAPGSPFRLSASRLSAEEMEAETLLASLTKHTRRHTIRPEYDARSLRWLLEILNRREDHGRFQKVLLRRSDGEVAGWYLYYPNPGGIGEVLQIGATADSIHDVLDHLFHHAWRLGAVALSGKLEPRFLHPPVGEAVPVPPSRILDARPCPQPRAAGSDRLRQRVSYAAGRGVVHALSRRHPPARASSRGGGAAPRKHPHRPVEARSSSFSLPWSGAA